MFPGGAVELGNHGIGGIGGQRVADGIRSGLDGNRQKRHDGGHADRRDGHRHRDFNQTEKFFSAHGDLLSFLPDRSGGCFSCHFRPSGEAPRNRAPCARTEETAHPADTLEREIRRRRGAEAPGTGKEPEENPPEQPFLNRETRSAAVIPRRGCRRFSRGRRRPRGCWG